MELTKQMVKALDNEIALLCHSRAKGILSDSTITDQQFNYAFELIRLYETFVNYEKPTK